LRRKGRPAVAFDPEGLVFAVASSVNTVKLFDSRSFDKGAFTTFQIDYPRPVEWTSINFSADGKYILLSTTENATLLLDAFGGHKVQTYHSYVNETSSALEPSFSPDGQFISIGSEDGLIRTYNTLSGQEVGKWSGHVGTVGVVKWNPKYLMAASCCHNLVFWQPNEY